VTAAPTVIDVRRDVEGVAIAVGELLLESLGATYRAAVTAKLEGCANLERALADFETDRILAVGYYGWAMHLMKLSQQLDLGLVPNTQTLLWHETEGIIATRAAQARFREEHPGCPHCGTPLWNRHAQLCQICGAEIERES
jgi:hypothetical protein